MRLRILNNTSQILFMVCAVVFFRIMYVDLYQSLQNRFAFQYGEILSLFFNNVGAMCLAFGLDTYAVWKVNKHISYVNNSPKRFWIDILLGIGISCVTLIPIFWRELWQGSMSQIALWRIAFTYLTIVLVNLVFIGIFDLVTYFHQSRQLLQKAQEKKTEAQYRYGMLKQQLNPHFLFNSLNILDYLINVDEKERASAFIRKLAAVYRYMLRMEGQDLVPLVEEKEFMEQYVDLLTERFPQGLFVKVDISDEALNKSVIPLSLQVLIENATKHNVVNTHQPLYIDIISEEDTLRVTNTLQPKLSASSTGIGLKNIDQQAMAIMGKHIEIEKTEKTFTVVLPLA